MFELVSRVHICGRWMWMVGIYHDRQNLDAAPHVCILILLLKALMLHAFTTFSGRLFQESTTRWGFQQHPPARGGTAQRKIFHLANWSQLIYPGLASSRSRFFIESSQLYAATLTHYSTEPLTTGPDYDTLLLLLALAGDVNPNP